MQVLRVLPMCWSGPIFKKTWYLQSYGKCTILAWKCTALSQSQLLLDEKLICDWLRGVPYSNLYSPWISWIGSTALASEEDSVSSSLWIVPSKVQLCCNLRRQPCTIEEQVHDSNFTLYIYRNFHGFLVKAFRFGRERTNNVRVLDL